MTNPHFGAAFAGPLFSPAPWPSLSGASLAAAKMLGVGTCSIPVWHGAPLTSSPSVQQASLVSQVGEAMATGLTVLVPPHTDGIPGDDIRLMWFLNPSGYMAWFTQVCEAMTGTGVIVELWNEAGYTAADAAKYGIGWGSVVAWYTTWAAQLAAAARANGLRIAVPLPLDQSPEQALLMAQGGAFPWAAMQRIDPEFVTAHLYPTEAVGAPLPGSIGRLRARIGVLVDVATRVGAKLLLSECNPGPNPQVVTDWSRVLSDMGVGHILWQWSSANPQPNDLSNTVFQAALMAGRPELMTAT